MIVLIILANIVAPILIIIQGFLAIRRYKKIKEVLPVNMNKGDVLYHRDFQIKLNDNGMNKLLITQMIVSILGMNIYFTVITAISMIVYYLPAMAFKSVRGLKVRELNISLIVTKVVYFIVVTSFILFWIIGIFIFGVFKWLIGG